MKFVCAIVTLLAVNAAFAADPKIALGEKIFAANCKSCHETGKPKNDAPQLSEADEWRQRLAGSKEALYKNSIEGVTGYYVMPPKGGNAALSNDEVKAAVDYILTKAGVP
jgi:cytochrome c5